MENNVTLSAPLDQTILRSRNGHIYLVFTRLGDVLATCFEVQPSINYFTLILLRVVGKKCLPKKLIHD